jgi:hypothetical protein
MVQIGLGVLLTAFISFGLLAAPNDSALPDILIEPTPDELVQPEVEPEPLIEAVQIYKEDELIEWINHNQHLNRVKADECQLVEDIQARADKVQIPAYQFLWGDMLAWGVCVPRNPELGIHYMWQAANQGLPAALEQLGRYYRLGILVQKDDEKAVILIRESASLGFLKAQLQLVDMLNQGMGSPVDYEDAYRWLYHAIIGDPKIHADAARLLANLADRMPGHIVTRAKSSTQPY